MLSVTAVTLNIIVVLSSKGEFFVGRMVGHREGEWPSLSQMGAERGIPGLVFYVDEE